MSDAFVPTLAWARREDQGDAGFRDQFHVPTAADGTPWVYLCGNSLGLQPRDVARSVLQDVEDWARLAVEGHFEARTPWYSYHEFLVDDMAVVVGAQAPEVAVMNSLTVNLHLMLASFYRPQGGRTVVLMEDGAFPSDQYAVETHLQARGVDAGASVRRLRPRDGEAILRTEDIERAIAEAGQALALVLLPGVHYYTGQAFPLKDITAMAHAAGATVGFDLAHAAGNVPLALHDWNVDFAVWCSYKYLNGGPGGVGGCFVHERHGQRPDLPRLAGWWGNDPATRFTMPEHFVPQQGAGGWQISNAPVLAMAALRPSLRLFRQAGMAELRARSMRLTGTLEALLRHFVPDIDVITPADRGCQLSVRLHQQARPVCDELKARGVIVDYRAPDVIRMAPVPLYNRFEDLWLAATQLASSLKEEPWQPKTRSIS